VKLTDSEVIAKIEYEERIAYGINDSELSDQRAQAIKYYLGEPFGNEVEGRSQVVSYDVQDTVESSLPQLIKIFTSGDQVVRFDPKGPEDEQAAQQETDYINHLVMEKNNGFEVMYCWFKDALISKNAYIKVYAEDEYSEEEETYEGLTDAQLQMLVQDDEVEVVEHSQYPDQIAMEQLQQAMQAQQQGQQVQLPQQQPMLHDVKIKTAETKKCIKIKNVAPESIMVSVDTAGLRLNDSRFVQHRESCTIDELKAQGFKVPDGVSSMEDDEWGLESNARDLYSEEFDKTANEEGTVMVKDTYIKIDGERWRYVIVGQHVLLKEKTEIVPFACITPMIMPHRHIGRSYSDLTMDIQLIKSALIRGQLDNMYLSNNGRYAISDRVNLEDMLVSRPGGVVRVQGEPGNAILPLQHTPFPPTSFTMVEYMDTMKEKRTGVTAYNQGLDADSLNKTATGINAIMQAAAARLELVARVFAETGVKDLFLMVHRLVRTTYSKKEIFRLRGKWVEVDPRGWKNRSDMTINVGLGTGNKDAQLMHIQTILGAQERVMQLGVATPQNVYNALIKLTQNAGFRHPEEFWTDPEGKPMPPPPPDPKIATAEMQLKADAQKFQAQTQVERERFEAEAKLDQQKFIAETTIEQQKAEQQAQQEQMRSQNDLIIEREKLQMQAELERYKADLKAETDMKIAVMNAEIAEREAAREAERDARDKQMQMAMHSEKIEAMTKAKKVVRDGSGRVAGVE